MSQLLMLWAHPDDEVLWGWPWLQQRSEFDIRLVLCAEDRNKRWGDRLGALAEVSKLLGVKFDCLGLNSFFAAMNQTEDRMIVGDSRLSYVGVCQSIKRCLASAEVVATHNPMGEYGHIDHRLVFQLALETNRTLLINDIHVPRDTWSTMSETPKRFRELYYRQPPYDVNCQLDVELFNRCKAIYVNHGAWTWGRDAVWQCSLYQVF